MPTVTVDKEELYKALGRSYTTKEFDELCFEFGIELDEDTTAEVEEAKKLGKLTEKPQLKIEIPANRYDLLCHEGISRALNIFLERELPPTYTVINPPNQKFIEMHVSKETSEIRPIVVAAILRNMHFTPETYANFIDLQDKLHQNIARKRTLVSVGTHDISTIQSPFSYEARIPKDIKFIALNQTKEMNGEELIKHFEENDRHISRYLHIIQNSPRYPVIYDANRVVLSLPPLINGEHSKITLNTKDVLIEVTATDNIKANIVLNIICAMFSQYCEDKFIVEPVKIIYWDGRTNITPHMEPRSTIADGNYINSCTGLKLSSEEICKLLNRMSLSAKNQNDMSINVNIPCTRPDILHECDIMEDAAIAYGFNNLKKSFPTSNTVAEPFAINQLADKVRHEIAMASWTECLSLILCSNDENFKYLNRIDDGSAVKLENPKTIEYQVVRTSLLPGILKTIRENRKHFIPIKVFEVSDVTFKDEKEERKARNERFVCAVYCSRTSGFEYIHGLLDRIMSMLEIPLLKKDSKSTLGYYIEGTGSENQTYFKGRGANIYLRKGNKNTDILIGSLGILHPNVLKNFDLDLPCSALEFSLEKLGIIE